MSTDDIQIRSCETHAEYQRCVEMQTSVWGFEDTDLVPKEIFIVAAKTGGQVHGAFDGDKLVGFAMAMPAIRAGNTYLHSHMLAVDASYRDRGLGRQLKLYQRSEALHAGIDLMEWTFDPLALKNAHLNINRLGAVMHRYVRNQYGETSSPLHAGVPTDRLVAAWNLNSPRVMAVLAGEAIATKDGEAAEVEIAVSTQIDWLRQDDPAAAKDILDTVRKSFESSFDDGLTVTGFRKTEKEGVYLLTHYEN